MKIAPIKNEKDYQAALKDLEKLFDSEPNTSQGDRAQMLVLLIEDYEKKHYPIEASVPFEQVVKNLFKKGRISKKVYDKIIK